MARPRKYATNEERDAARREKQREYIRRYEASEKGREAHTRYAQSAKGQATYEAAKARKRTPEGRARGRAAQKEYYHSPQGTKGRERRRVRAARRERIAGMATARRVLPQPAALSDFLQPFRHFLRAGAFGVREQSRQARRGDRRKAATRKRLTRRQV